MVLLPSKLLWEWPAHSRCDFWLRYWLEEEALGGADFHITSGFIHSSCVRLLVFVKVNTDWKVLIGGIWLVVKLPYFL